MNFEWALERLREGKEVRRKLWEEDYSIYLSQDGFWYKKKNAEFRHTFYIYEFEADDWELKRSINLEKINNEVIYSKRNLMEPKEIWMNQDTLEYLIKKETRNSLNWTYKPRELLGMKIMIDDHLKGDEFELKC